MRRLKPRNRRVDTLRSEARPKKRGRIGRIVYFVFLGGLGFLLFDTFVGDLIYLSGDGMVTREVSVVSVGYSGRVAQLTVSEGDRVRAGERLMQIPSQVMESRVARLTSDLTDAETRAAEFRAERRQLEELLPEARERREAMADYRERLASLSDRGLTTLGPQARTIMDSFEALRDVKELEARQEVIAEQLSSAETTAFQVRTSLAALRDIYSGGRVEAPADGLVGTLNVSTGSNVSQGDRLAEIFHGPRHVIGYVPTGALYSVDTGERVALRSGFDVMFGTVTKVSAIAQRLPEEFQKAFQAAERAQLLRIRLDDREDAPPVFTKVHITWPNGVFVTVTRGINIAAKTLGRGLDWLWDQVRAL